MIWIVSGLIAYFVKGLCGFAETLVYTTLLSLWGLSNAVITPVAVMLSLPANVYLAWRCRRHVRIASILPVFCAIVLGMIPGILFLKSVNPVPVKVIFGVVIAAFGLEMMLRRGASHKKLPPLALYALGVLSGLICGMYGVGALAAVLVSQVTDDAEEFKACLGAIYAVSAALLLVGHGLTGLLTWQTVRQAALMVPCMVAGLLLGMKVSGKMEENVKRRTIGWFLLVSGVLVVVSSGVLK